jgi:hypothetical protein
MRLTIRADSLQVGDVLVTSIGRAPILAIDRTHDGVELVLDTKDSRCTRGRNQGSVLWYWPHQTVRVERKRAKRAA